MKGRQSHLSGLAYDRSCIRKCFPDDGQHGMVGVFAGVWYGMVSHVEMGAVYEARAFLLSCSSSSWSSSEKERFAPGDALLDVFVSTGASPAPSSS